jgi:hypothetical protein
VITFLGGGKRVIFFLNFYETNNLHN